MDILDNAQILENRHRDTAIARARASAPQGPGRSHCLDCDEPISKARREAVPGCQRCIDCQRELEK